MQYTAAEREELGVETEEEDAEVVIARLDIMTDAVTMLILVRYTEKENKRLLQDVQEGKMSVLHSVEICIFVFFTPPYHGSGGWTSAA